MDNRDHSDSGKSPLSSNIPEAGFSVATGVPLQVLSGCNRSRIADVQIRGTRLTGTCSMIQRLARRLSLINIPPYCAGEMHFCR
jgi:hypothetical protein